MLRCLGFVFKYIFYALLFTAGICIFTAFVLMLTIWSASWFGIDSSDKNTIWFLFFWMAVFGGGTIGGIACMEERARV